MEPTLEITATWVLSRKEYLECYLDKFRVLENFPHVKCPFIWKKYYFAVWKSKKGPLHLQRKQQACLENTGGLLVLPAKIRQSFREINSLNIWVGLHWDDSSLYSCLRILFSLCMQDVNFRCQFQFILASSSSFFFCRKELQRSWTEPDSFSAPTKNLSLYCVRLPSHLGQRE